MTDEHRALRELLGEHALGALPPDVQAGLDAHLDGCASCRAELAELRPVVERLRVADPDALAPQVDPPADLGGRISRRIAAERALPSIEGRPARPPRLAAAAAAVVVLAAAVGLGAVVGRQTAPGSSASPPAVESPAPRIPLETVPVVTAAGVRSGDAAIIAHTWGVEARFTGSGFLRGERYRAAFRAQDGRVLPAGEFVGTGGRTLTCNLQSALLREAAAAFLVLDADGRTVLSADLPA